MYSRISPGKGHNGDLLFVWDYFFKHIPHFSNVYPGWTVAMLPKWRPWSCVPPASWVVNSHHFWDMVGIFLLVFWSYLSSLMRLLDILVSLLWGRTFVFSVSILPYLWNTMFDVSIVPLNCSGWGGLNSRGKWRIIVSYFEFLPIYHFM